MPSSTIAMTAASHGQLFGDQLLDRRQPSLSPCFWVVNAGLASGALRLVRFIVLSKLPHASYYAVLIVGGTYIPFLSAKMCFLARRSSLTQRIPVEGVLSLLVIGLLEHLAYAFLFLPTAVLEGWVAMILPELGLPFMVLLGTCQWRRFSMYHYVGSVFVVLGTVVAAHEASDSIFRSWATAFMVGSQLFFAINQLVKRHHLSEYDYDDISFNFMVAVTRLCWGLLLLPIGISLEKFLYQAVSPTKHVVPIIDPAVPAVVTAALLFALAVLDVASSSLYSTALCEGGARRLPAALTIGAVATLGVFIPTMSAVATISSATIFLGVAVARMKNEADIRVLDQEECGENPA
jgi:hypothetical protein